MPLVIPAGFAQVTVPLANTALGRAAAVTYGVEINGVNIGVDPNALAGVIQELFVAGPGSIMDSGVVIGPTTISIGTGVEGENLGGLAATSSSGNQDFASVPPNVAVLVRKSTARGGRRGRGRFYFPWFVAEGNVNEGGFLSGPAIAATDNVMVEWLNEQDDADLQMVILHNSEGPGSTTPDRITALTTQVQVATQQRRLGR